MIEPPANRFIVKIINLGGESRKKLGNKKLFFLNIKLFFYFSLKNIFIFEYFMFFIEFLKESNLKMLDFTGK